MKKNYYIFIITVSLVVTTLSGLKESSAYAGSVKVRLSVTLFESGGVSKSFAEKISKKLYNKISDIKGKKNVLFRKVLDKRNANRILTGRISKLGKSTVIAISIIHGESGRMLFTKTIIGKNDKDINSKLESVAKKICASSKIWKL